jgi:hypothetical protein
LAGANKENRRTLIPQWFKIKNIKKLRNNKNHSLVSANQENKKTSIP